MKVADENSEEFVFRAITVTKKNPIGTLINTSNGLLYQVRKILLDELEEIEEEFWSTQPTLIKRHGRWKSSFKHKLRRLFFQLYKRSQFF